MAGKHAGVKRCVAGCCCCCACFLLIVGATIGVIASTFEKPEVTVMKAQFTGFELTASNVSFTVESAIHIDNPNGWPIKGSVETLIADMWSMDKDAADEIGELYYLGQASLPEPIVVDTNSEAEFDVSTAVFVQTSDTSSVSLLARLNRDCGMLAADKTTKLRIKITKTVATVADVELDLSGLEIPLETLVPCNGLGDSTPAPLDTVPGNGLGDSTAAPSVTVPGLR